MRCFYCKQESEWLDTKISHVVDLEGRIIIIKNVPCRQCPCCGDAEFTNNVAEKMDEVFEIAKKTMYDYVEMDYEDPTRQVYKLVKIPVNTQEHAAMRGAEDTHNYGNKN